MKIRWLIALGFIGTILLGAVLLALPAASAHASALPFGDALFTSCSAVCITGLSVIEPGVDLSLFGQSVLLALVELGCLGIMTLGTFLLVVMGQRLSLASEFSLKDAFGTHGVKGLRGLIVWVVSATLVMEALGTVVLWWCFTHGAAGSEGSAQGAQAWFRAFFYAVMSFSNAGFALDPGSVAVFRHAPLVLAVLEFEIITGGIGFFVLYNIFTIRFWRRNLIARGRLSLHSRVVLIGSAVMLLVAFAFYFGIEYNHALKPFAGWEKASVAFFQAVTARTCGLTVVPMEQFQDVTGFLTTILMFIGAAPGGAGGGIKITTFVVFLLTIAAIYRGGRETVIARRTIPMDLVREAFVIFFFFTAAIVLATLLLLFTEGGALPVSLRRNFIFEIISAITTTGLSYGDTTRSLSPAGRGIVMVCMLFGRLGAITVVMLVGGREETVATVKYPKEEIVVG